MVVFKSYDRLLHKTTEHFAAFEPKTQLVNVAKINLNRQSRLILRPYDSKMFGQINFPPRLRLAIRPSSSQFQSFGIRRNTPIF